MSGRFFDSNNQIVGGWGMRTIQPDDPKTRPITKKAVIGFAGILVLGAAVAFGVSFLIDYTPKITEITVDVDQALFVASAPGVWSEGLDSKGKEDMLFETAFRVIARETFDRKKSTLKVDTLVNRSPKLVILQVTWKNEE